MSNVADYRPLVRVRNLRFRYPGAAHDVLAIPALDIAGSGLTALVGASGAGKSTLVELLAGTLREPYEGSIETLGVDVSILRGDAERQRHLRRIGFIPQDFGLLPGRTIRQILDQDLADAQIPRGEHAARIENAAQAVGLTEFLDRQSNLLSGGQRQRAAIARMLARDVELVIADEPTANLDPERAREVLALFRQLAATRPVIIVTHDPWLATECQRTVLLQAAGESGEAGPPRSPRTRWWPWAIAAAVGAGIVGGGAFAVARSGSTPSGGVASPSSASTLSQSDFIAKANMLCRNAAASAPPTPSLNFASLNASDFSTIASYLGSAVSVGQSLQSNLQGLGAPPSNQSTWSQALSEYQTVLTDLQAAQGAAQSLNTSAYSAALDKGGTDTSAKNTAFRNFGATACTKG